MRPIYYIFSLAFLSLVSCAENYGYEAEKAPESGKTIVFTLSNSSPVAEVTRGTRAIDDIVANEGVINRLDVFFYDADGGECLFYPEAAQIAIDGNSKVTITIPEATYDDNLIGNTCGIYIMANCPISRAELEGLSLDDLKGLVIENGEDRSFNLSDPPEDFFMTGETSVTIDREKSQNLGKITLERAAAKIVLDISNARVVGYSPGKARVRISNYLDKTKLDGDYQYEVAAGSANYKTATKTLTAAGGENNSYFMDTENALYTYSNDWNEDIGRETYITIELDWTKQEDGTVKTYYYRIPFSYINAGEDAEAHKNRIRRNFVYQFMVDVSQLGGLDPEDALNLTANFDIINWSSRTVEVSILSYHYLFVYNSRMEIHHASSYEWEYKSSLPVKFMITKAECTEYYRFGDPRLIQYEPGQQQYPVINTRVADGRTYFSVNSMIPVNYVPLHIGVKVSNAAQLFSDVELIIFPEQYVTASYSEGHGTANEYPQAGAYGRSLTMEEDGLWGTNYPNGPGGEENNNFYMITTTSLPEREIMIDGELHRMSIGDPTILKEDHPFPNLYDYYETDPSLNHIISPQFVVASRRGATSLDLDWEKARQRCLRYRESQYPASTWRVPTFAELALISHMQNDPNSAIKELFSTSSGASSWWTALENIRLTPGAYSYETGNGVTRGGLGPVRCVHDTWRD